MLNQMQITPRSRHRAVRRAITITLPLLIALLSPTAWATPPATVATCAGIKDAYPILGTQCENNYARVNHAPTDAHERLETYYARIAVIEIFRKALMCNGMYGASRDAQNRFKSKEAGHLTAITNLHTAMLAAADPVIPALYTANDLKAVSIKKQQCK